MGLIEKSTAIEFLGQEFATWLYWHSETNARKFNLEGVEEFELWFEAPCTVSADFGEATVITLKGGTALESPEARQAFREGKKVERTRLRMNHRNQTYTFSLVASKLSISGLKIPVPPNTTPADYLFIRLEIFEEFEAFFQQIVNAFLALRLDDRKWHRERDKMRQWVMEFELT